MDGTVGMNVHRSLSPNTKAAHVAAAPVSETVGAEQNGNANHAAWSNRVAGPVGTYGAASEHNET